MYKVAAGYSDKATSLFTLDLGSPQDLPDALRGESWMFVQVPACACCLCLTWSWALWCHLPPLCWGVFGDCCCAYCCTSVRAQHALAVLYGYCCLPICHVRRV